MRPPTPSFASTMPSGWLPPPAKRSESTFRIVSGYLIAGVLALPVLRFMSISDVPLIHQFIAYCVILLCGWPVVSHLTRRQVGLPVFAIICLVYAAGYAVPAFTTAPIVMSTTDAGFVPVSEGAVTEALWLTLLGVFSMQVGFWLFKYSMLSVLVPRFRLKLDIAKARKWALALGTVGAVTMWLGLNGNLHIPAAVFGLFVVLNRQSYLVIGVLYWYYAKGQLSGGQKLWFAALILTFVMLGFATGNFRNVLDPMMVIIAVHWMLSRKFPWKIVLAGVALFLVVQPLKGEYRALVWKQGVAQGSIIGRLQVWQDLFMSDFARRASAKHFVSSRRARRAFGRTDFLHMFGHVIEETPRRVPYQHGSTYSYLLVTLIPRFLWPDKPSAQTANDFFGVSYGFQTPDSLGTTSIGMPQLVETYINFGQMGVVFVMLLLGMVYSIMERMFNHPEAGEGGAAAYGVVLTMVLTIETATAPTFGALVQTILILILTLRFVRLNKQLPAPKQA